MILSANDDFTAMFEVLEMKHNVHSTEQFRRDINRLVNTEPYKFITRFLADFSRMEFKDLKRYERLKLTDSQNRRMNGFALFRYSYRNNSNLRCIYMVQDENTKKVILLNAFNEDWSKSKGKNTYDLNIERAIKTYKKYKEET